MPTMINRGKELIRICPKNSKKLEYSTNDGRTWVTRCVASGAVGEFEDLVDNGDELLATTNKGLFYSRTEGKTWIIRHR